MDPTRDPTHDPTRGPTTDPTHVTITDAAKRLGLSTEAVRMRVKRGTLASTRMAGTVYVLLPQPNAGPNGGPNDQMALVRSLEDQVAYLRRQLATRDEELRRKDHLLAAALERIPPQLEAPRDTPPESPASPDLRNGHEAATVEPEGVDQRPANGGAQEAAEPRSWWRR